MFLRRTEFGWEALARAKLNLCLEVLGRRPDGFHEVETLVVPVQLHDTLAWQNLHPSTSTPLAEIELRVLSPHPVRSPALPSGGDNLIVRAVKLLRQRAGTGLGARIVLTKRIPTGAGLGGGSSDAATALEVANRAWGLGYSHDQLLEVAEEIGSDVPALLAPTAVLARGRGERTERVRGLPPLACVVVQPTQRLLTPRVFARWDDQATGTTGPPSSGAAVRVIRSLREGRLAEAAQMMNNGLQAAAESLAPILRLIRQQLDQMDVLGHQMSGSGSAYFAVCRSARHARRIAQVLRQHSLGEVYATRCCQ